MFYCQRRCRGVLEKAACTSVIFRRDCTYKRMLEKCVEAVYSPDEKKDAEFHIADSRGSIIPTTIKLDSSEGVEIETLPWTIENYISITNMYASKAKFYCLRKGKSAACIPVPTINYTTHLLTQHLLMKVWMARLQVVMGMMYMLIQFDNHIVSSLAACVDQAAANG